MRKRSLRHGLLYAVLLALTPALAQADGPQGDHHHGVAVDRLGVEPVQQVAGQTYRLAFVGPPAANGHILQEYLPAGQALGSYTDMLLLQHLPTDASPQQFAQSKLDDLHARRAGGDALVNGELLAGEGGAAVLDFVMSANLPDGRLLVEWNAYHYRRQAGGITMTALSRRAYGEADALVMLRGLKEARHRDRQALLAWLPEVKPVR